MPGARLNREVHARVGVAGPVLLFQRHTIPASDVAFGGNYALWRERLYGKMRQISPDSTRAARNAMMSAEKVYSAKWDELDEILQKGSTTIVSKAINKQNATSILLRVADLHHEGYKLFWDDLCRPPELEPIKPAATAADARKILKFDDHADNPYPSKADKEELVARTGLSLKKIDYFAWNARKRNKDKYAVKTPKSRTAK